MADEETPEQEATPETPAPDAFTIHKAKVADGMKCPPAIEALLAGDQVTYEAEPPSGAG